MRSVRDFIRDKRISQAAQFDYRRAASEITDLALTMKEVGADEKAKEYRRLAFIAANAARAEFFDPPTPGYGVAERVKGERPPWDST